MNADPALVLAEHVCHTSFTGLPDVAVIATKRDILDTLGAALGGSVAPGIRELAGLVKHWGGTRRAQSVSDRRQGACSAGGLGQCHHGPRAGFDDTFDRAGSIYPGTSTLAASLAIAERQGGRSGRDFVLAVTLGLDVACRLALAATVDRGWHRTAAFGIFGATAAAGKLLGLTFNRIILPQLTPPSIPPTARRLGRSSARSRA